MVYTDHGFSLFNRIQLFLQFYHMITAGSDLAGILVEPFNISFIRLFLKQDRLNKRRLRTRTLSLYLLDSAHAELNFLFETSFFAHIGSSFPSVSFFIKGFDEFICLRIPLVEVIEDIVY